MFNRFPR